MSASVPNERARSRTRATILHAAVPLLTAAPNASLGDIANTAGVARSTLHRYFPDRESLVAGIDSMVEATYHEALDRADIDRGSGVEAFGRLMSEILDRLDEFAWWWRSDSSDTEVTTAADERVIAVLERGQRDGSVDSDFDPHWIIHTVWSLLWAVSVEARAGRRTERELREMCLRATLKVVAQNRTPQKAH